MFSKFFDAHVFKDKTRSEPHIRKIMKSLGTKTNNFKTKTRGTGVKRKETTSYKRKPLGKKKSWRKRKLERKDWKEKKLLDQLKLKRDADALKNKSSSSSSSSSEDEVEETAADKCEESKSSYKHETKLTNMESTEDSILSNKDQRTKGNSESDSEEIPKISDHTVVKIKQEYVPNHKTQPSEGSMNINASHQDQELVVEVEKEKCKRKKEKSKTKQTKMSEPFLDTISKSPPPHFENSEDRFDDGDQLTTSPVNHKGQKLDIQAEEISKTEDTANVSSSQSKTRNNGTVSMALPGSILDNAQSLELKTYLAGQIARSAVIFQIDEIVIFDEHAQLKKKEVEEFNNGFQDYEAKGQKLNCNIQLASILQYLECPQYLRKSLFPLRKDLKYAGLCNPLDTPHHMRKDDLSIPYREAVVVDVKPKDGKGSFCNGGLSKPIQIERRLEPGIRLTVELKSFNLEQSRLRAITVSPDTPRQQSGIYWGYRVRLAGCIGQVFADSPYPDGYDVTIGTSERGNIVDDTKVSPGKHTLIVFGGVGGLEPCVENDDGLEESEPASLFRHYLNTCPLQGSRTIRTEEAILISLSALRPALGL